MNWKVLVRHGNRTLWYGGRPPLVYAVTHAALPRPYTGTHATLAEACVACGLATLYETAISAATRAGKLVA